MKFNVNQQDLQQALNYCQGVIEKRSTLPILSNILLEVKNSKLTITATDLDLIFIHQIENIEVFEEVVLGKTRLLPNPKGSTTSCSFSHIFAGGYAAGYYSYKWAEVLEADAFEEFKKNGIFNRDTAKSFRDNILSKGNLKHPMELYKDFKGSEPSLDALLERDGLLESTDS